MRLFAEFKTMETYYLEDISLITVSQWVADISNDKFIEIRNFVKFIKEVV